MPEYLIRFFHRIYIFYSWGDIDTAQGLYQYYKNYDEFDNALEKRGIVFTMDLNYFDEEVHNEKSEAC
jgi:hypothetical protein